MEYWKKTIKRNSVVKDKYFTKQLLTPKFSTISFFDYIRKNTSIHKSVIDFGCGNGANLDYVKRKYKISKNLLGIDINPHLIKFAKKNFSSNNVNFIKQDIHKFDKKLQGQYEMAICIQVLPYIDNHIKFIKNVSKFKTKYFVFSCLIWEGLINYNIKVNFLKNKKQNKLKHYKNYNIYSLENIINNLKESGFKKIKFKKFEINKPLKIKDKKNIGTYTIQKKKKFIQMSGPINMNWYFMFCSK